MAVLTPTGIKIRRDYDEVFGLLARLHNVNPYKVLKRVEYIERAP
jgi:hypothetical protein